MDGIGGQTGNGDAAQGGEDELAVRQDAKLYPVGKALRRSYDADYHATLGKDVTGLMLDLAHVPFEPHEFKPIFPMPQPVRRPGWLARVRQALRRRG